MSYYKNAIEIKKKMDKNQDASDMMEKVGNIAIKVIQSDKLGFDLHKYYVNEILVKQEYVEQEHTFGLQDNPIKYERVIPLIQNAFYIKNGVIKVWMGKAGVFAEWEDKNFVEWY